MTRRFAKPLFVLVIIGSAMLMFTMIHSTLAQSDVDRAAALKAQLWSQKLFALALQSQFTLKNAPQNAMRPLSIGSTPPWNKVVFQSYRDGNWEIYMMDPDGGHQQRLTHNDVPDLEPRLHPDLRSILYVSYQNDLYHIYKMDPDGSNPVQLSTSYQSDASPAWSPDGNRIVFSRRKEKHWTIFIMNANGSGGWQVTYPANANADDIYPVWSPDGSQIAWLRVYSDGVGDLMLMNADGSNARRLRSDLRYPQHLAWSPDGKYIAFDADVDRDYWNELTVYSVYNESLRSHFFSSPSEPLVDLWAGSWAPDSQHFLFTEVHYTVQDNKLYLAETRLEKTEIFPGSYSPTPIPGTGMDMSPDWREGIDTQPPTASIQPLPAVSPSPIQVSWSGEDVGRSGLKSFDVQVQEDGAEWVDWLTGTTDTHRGYDGLAGHRYAFRVRARDNVGNVGEWTPANAAVTTVESLLPHSRFVYLPRYLSTRSGVIRWQGEDTGGSGIRYYSVQCRDVQGGDWKNIAASTTLTETEDYELYGLFPGHDYFFRVRAVDRAGNKEPWDETGQGPVTAYLWGITGTVTTNRGRPVPHVQARSQPAAWMSKESDTQGHYTLYDNAWSKSYTVTWAHPSLGVPPTTTFSLDQGDAQVDVTLLPVDNLLQDGSFEEPETVWNLGGTFQPRITTLHHTGQKAMQIGLPPGPDGHITTPHDASHLMFRQDGRDNLYLLWNDHHRYNLNYDLNDLMYAQLNPDGSTSEIRTIEANIIGYERAMAVSHNGHVYITWKSPSMEHHYALLHRTPDGHWSQIKRLELSSYGVTAATDSHDILHLADREGRYMQCTPTNTCSQIEDIGIPESLPLQSMVVMQDGTAYFAWTSDWYYDQPEYIYYRIRHADGTWSPIFQLEPDRYADKFTGLRFVVDSHGVMHFLVHDTEQKGNSYHTYELYVRLTPDGHGTAFLLPSGSYALILGQGDVVHIPGITGKGSHYAMRYTLIEPDGRVNISDQQPVPRQIARVCQVDSAYRFTADSRGQVYAVIYHDDITRKDIYVAVRGLDGKWIFWDPFGNGCITESDVAEGAPQTLIDSHDVPQMVWPGGYPHCDIFHARLGASQTGDSTLSQRVTIPADMNSPTLSFDAMVKYAPNSRPHRLEIGVQTEDGQNTTILTLGDVSSDWTHHWVDMSRWQGQTITLTLNMPQEKDTPISWATVDDISLGSGAYPDLWVSAMDVACPVMTQTLSLDIRYGNRSQDAAHGATVTYTLPMSTSLQSANPAPSGDTGDRVWWDVGNISPGQQGTIHVTLNMPPDSQPGDVFTGGLSIKGREVDVYPDDNAQDVDLFVEGHQLRLPLVLAR